MFRRFLAIILPLYLAAAGLLSAAPATLVQSVTSGGKTITMRLTKQNLRGTHFELRTQNAAGTYDTITPVEERSYLGTVDENPDAIASGIIQDDGQFRGAVYFDRGSTWFTLGNAVQFTKGMDQPTSFGYPGWTTTPGQAGTTMYGFDVGIDASYNYFNLCAGQNVARTFEYIEFSVAVTRALYMQNVLVRPYLGRVIIRTSKEKDPANGKGGQAYLDAVKSEWNNNQKSADRDVVAGISKNSVGGGLAWVNTIGTENGYSISDSGNDGEFTVVWRHELGHNWGLNHYDGGSPEGGTINSDNKFARMSGPEAERALSHRNNRLHILDNEGTYTTVPIPPYAAIDSAKFLQAVDSQIVIDVVANDHDANGDSLSLISVPTTSVNGGTLIQQGQKVIYQPAGVFAGIDSFTYKIQDSRGQTATGAVAIDVQLGEPLRLYLPLDDTLGSAAEDFSIFHNTGLLSGADFSDASVAGKFGKAVNLDGVNDHVTVNGIKQNSNTVTLAGWIKRGAAPNEWAGIIFDRSANSGLSIRTSGELRYQWNNAGEGFESNLITPAGVWTFVALVVEPDKATIYMNDGTGFQSAVNNVSHWSAKFGTVILGWDSYLPQRHFTGAIDDVRIYGKALNQTQLQSLFDGGAAEGPTPFDGASNVGAVDLSWVPSPVATQYQVYLGTNPTAVQNATTASPEYRGTVTAPQLVNPPTTAFTTYYWRVDTTTVNGTISGPVWHFSRDGASKVAIGNFSFEDGPLVEGVPPAWTLLTADPTKLGTGAGGSDGGKMLYIGPDAVIRQDLNYTLTAGETITLKYDFNSSRRYTRSIQLLAKNGGTYTLLAETTDTTGSGAWPTITLNHTVAAAHAGQQLAIRISSGNWNEFDNFRITTTVAPPVSTNHPPVFTSDPISLPTATALISYVGHSLASSATDTDSDPLTYAKLSGPAWLSVAPDGSLSGTPAANNAGPNSFVIRVSDPAGGMDFADLTIPVADARFYYDTNGVTAGSGAASGGIWDSSAVWTSDPTGASATFAWQNTATAVFSAGSDATSDYTVTNDTTRVIGGFIARSGRPLITGSPLRPGPATPFIVEATALGARIDSVLTASGDIVKSGPGTLILGGNNTFTGNTTINEGVLELAPGAKLYNGGANDIAVVTIATGGTWRLPVYSSAGLGQLSEKAGRRSLGGGTIEVTGPSHSSSLNFTVQSTGGTFRYTAVGQTLTLAGNASGQNSYTSGILTFDTLGNILVTGTAATIEGSGSLVKTGPAKLTLGNGGNRFFGDLTVNAGTLEASASNTGSFSALGWVLGTRSIFVNSPGNMDWTANDILGGTKLTAAKVPPIALNGSSLKTTRFNAIGNVTLAGATLINANATDPVAYDGFQFLGTLTANGTSPSAITTTTGKGNHLLGAATTEFSVTDSAGLLTVSTILRNGSTSYPGTGSLRKTGPGTLALTATNAYTGTTTIEGGTLALSGSLNGPTTVAVGGQLSGNGSVIAPVNVQSGGTLAPTAGGTLTTGALTLAADSTLAANGSMNVLGDVDVSGVALQIASPTARVLVSYSGIRSGEFAAATVPAGWKIEYDDVAKEIRLIASTGGYDVWIAGFTTGGKSGFSQDADDDGVINGLEFLFGGDPTIAGDSPSPTFAATPGGGFTYTFTRADRALENCTIIVKLSDDLAIWPPARDIVIGTNTATPATGVTFTDLGDHDSISIDIPGTPTRTFLRLEVGVPAAP